MTEFDRASLDRLLPATPGSADWNDVMSRFRAHQGRRRRRIVVLAAAALVGLVGTASAFSTVRDFILDRGFVGVPPEGATPSAPESGELVISYLGHGPSGIAYVDRHADLVRVYADGRLIWFRRGELPRGANQLFTGLLEQRLTSDGVELMRSAIVSTGLVGGGYSESAPSYTPIQVRHGDRLVPLTWPSGRVVKWATDLGPLVARLTDPESWLPASAWEDREIRAYVPSKYAVCLEAGPPWQPIDPSHILTLLPAQVEDLLRARGFDRYAKWPYTGFACSKVTTEEARALADALEDAGLERVDRAYRLAYRSEATGSIGESALIWFEPYLPDGEWICRACG